MKKIIEILRKNKQIVMYLFFGVCTTAINTVCYGVLYKLFHISNISSTILAWLVAVVFAFFTNKIYVFESKQAAASKWLKEFASFFTVRILTGILDVIIMAVAVDYMQWNGLVWKLISNAIVIVINYIASKFLIFKKNKKAE